MTEERYSNTLRVVLKAHSRLAAFGSCTMAVCRKHPEIVKTIPAAAATLRLAGCGTRVTSVEKWKNLVCSSLATVRRTA
jgi:hypothetical protein